MNWRWLRWLVIPFKPLDLGYMVAVGWVWISGVAAAAYLVNVEESGGLVVGLALLGLAILAWVVAVWLIRRSNRAVERLIKETEEGGGSS